MKTLVTLLLLSLSLPALAREGFFKEEQLATEFSVTNARKASLFVEEKKDGKWKHMGNAFFVSRSGYLITNYHIARNCLRDQKAYFAKRFSPTNKLYEEGFLSGKNENLICNSLRVTSDPASGKYLSVSVAALPPIGRESAPSWDFAVLKLSEPAEPGAWFELRKENQISTDVYLVGFPAYTERKENSKMMQNGEYEEVKAGDYRLATGNVLPFRENFLYEAQQNNFLYTDTDGGPGSSGSALLNAQGGLVGLILGTGSRPNFSDRCVPHFAYCSDIALYLKTSYLIEQLQAHFPSLAVELTNFSDKNVTIAQ